MLRLEGVVKARRPDGLYDVELQFNSKRATIISYVSGKWKHRYKNGKIIVGDKVLVEISPYDKNKGKIIRKVR